MSKKGSSVVYVSQQLKIYEESYLMHNFELEVIVYLVGLVKLN